MKASAQSNAPLKNPFALSVPFNANVMGDISKIVIPAGDKIANYVPLAHVLLGQKMTINGNTHPLLERIEFLKDERRGGKTTINMILNHVIAGGAQKFEISPEQEQNMRTLLVNTVGAMATRGQTLVRVNDLVANHDAAKLIDPTKLNPEVRKLYDTAYKQFDEKASAHGGAFEIVDIYGVDGAQKKSYMSEDKADVEIELVTFGACSGCSSFVITYGSRAKTITEALPDSEYQVSQVVQSEQYKGGLVIR